MFGAEKAWGTDYLKGSWDEWEGLITFTDGVATVTLTASETPYQFGIDNGGAWRSVNGGSITGDVSGWWFNSTSGNVSLKATIDGVYTVVITGWTNEGQSFWFPIVSVYYPQEYEPRTGLTIGNFGTICMTKEAPIADITGAEFYSIYGKDAETPTELYLVKEEDKLVAGRPYIFKATATSISTKLIGAPTSEGNHNGLYGTFETSLSVESTNENPLYILSNNTVVKAGSGCSITNGRAYIKMNEVPVTAAPSAPSAIRLDLEENGATSIDAIEASEKAVKFIENGQMYILRGGIKYDATGRVVK